MRNSFKSEIQYHFSGYLKNRSAYITAEQSAEERAFSPDSYGGWTARCGVKHNNQIAIYQFYERKKKYILQNKSKLKHTHYNTIEQAFDACSEKIRTVSEKAGYH